MLSMLVASLLVLVLDRPVSSVPYTFLKSPRLPSVVFALVCLLVLCTCELILLLFFFIASLSVANMKSSGIMIAYFANWGTQIHMADTFNRWVSSDATVDVVVLIWLTYLPYRLSPLHSTSCSPASS